MYEVTPEPDELLVGGPQRGRVLLGRVRAGISCSSSAIAASCRIPVGSPAASRRMTPPGGSAVPAATPASASAREFATAMCPSSATTSNGRSVGSASRSARVGCSGIAVASQRSTAIQSSPPGRARARSDPRSASRKAGLSSRQVVERRPSEHDAARERVQVRVVDAGHEHPPAEVDHLGPRARSAPARRRPIPPRRSGRRAPRRPRRPAPPWSRPGRLPGRCPRRSCADCNGAARERPSRASTAWTCSTSTS